MFVALHPFLLAQHGLVTRRQALTAGLTSRQVDHLLHLGLLAAVHRGVFRDPAVPVTLDQRGLAATLAAGPGSMVSHRMAVATYGMPNVVCNLAEILATQRVARPGLIAHRVNSAPAPRVVRGVPTTTPARTLLDCATVVAPPTLARFVATWSSTGIVRIGEIEDELRRQHRHRGGVPLTEVLSGRLSIGEEADSPAELALGDLLVRHGLPTPALHHLVTVATGATFELDWSYPELRAAFEMDGYGIHLRSLDAFEHDRIRRNELEIDGWTILNFTSRMLRRKPKKVVDQVRRLLAGTDTGTAIDAGTVTTQ